LALAFALAKAGLPASDNAKTTAINAVMILIIVQAPLGFEAPTHQAGTLGEQVMRGPVPGRSILDFACPLNPGYACYYRSSGDAPQPPRVDIRHSSTAERTARTHP